MLFIHSGTDIAKAFGVAPECDFIFAGAWPDTEPLTDDDYDEGLYHALNAERDGIYLISSAGFYGLLPHFEIGGR